mmetsp:Transcript_53798/g.114859  ORF Transcript_53798/g.114859 Transcript_53798/m.114859 type:complete len:295 (+) Transcript_53798:63-947(+)
MFGCCSKSNALSPRGTAIPEGIAEKVETLKSSPSLEGRKEAAEELGKIPQAAHLSVPTLVQKSREDDTFVGKYDDRTYPVREACLASLEGLAKALTSVGEGAASAVVKPLTDPSKLSAEGTEWYDRAAACWALAFFGKAITKEQIDAMIALVEKDEDLDVTRYARAALEQLPPSIVHPAIAAFAAEAKFEESEERVLVAAVWALGCLQQAQAEPDVSKIIENLDDGNTLVRREAVLTLAKFPQLAATTVPLIDKKYLDNGQDFFSQAYPVREARLVALQKLAEAGSEEAKEALE